MASAQSTFAVALFDELARGGMTDVVVCPGSRSTPLVLAVADAPGLRMHVRLDERSAGFFAIGRALATRAPVGIVVTSGTAAAELTAAVVEADLAGVPLVVITADRPPELRGIGAPQTIDQVKLFGGAVRRFEDPGVIRLGTERSWRPMAARVLAAAVEGAGPVHLNLPFVEPLDAPPGVVPPGRAHGAPWRVQHRRGDGDVPLDVLDTARGLLVAGRGAGDPRALVAAASRLGWPLLADPLSGARFDHPNVVGAFDALVRDGGLRAELQPEVVVVLGSLPASRALADALVAWAPRTVAVSVSGWPDDPHGLVSDVVASTPSAWSQAVAASRGSDPVASSYLAHWRVAESAAQGSFDASLATELTEPAVARLLSRSLSGSGVPLVASNSMPVRDLEWFGAKAEEPPTVVANRGANGIDGVVSTSLGVAAGARAVALLGDLAFLHDAGSLADGVGDRPGCCVLVVLDNRGGGIFSFLPQRGSVAPEVFERVFATPPRVELAAVAAGYGAEVAVVKDLDALRDAVARGLTADGVSVVVAVVPDRDRNVELHRVLAERAAGDARAALGR